MLSVSSNQIITNAGNKSYKNDYKLTTLMLLVKEEKNFNTRAHRRSTLG